MTGRCVVDLALLARQRQHAPNTGARGRGIMPGRVNHAMTGTTWLRHPGYTPPAPVMAARRWVRVRHGGRMVLWAQIRHCVTLYGALKSI